MRLRSECIPTRFGKYFGKDAPDGLALVEKVLSNPEYCRETAERLMQLELELNGVEGLGYNDRYRKLTKNEKEEWFHNIVKTAIFGGKAEKYSSEYQAFLDTGQMPGSVPRHYRKKMDGLKLNQLTGVLAM